MEINSVSQGLDMQNSNDLLVAIWMVTYNHEKYISKAIEGIISQSTNFRYEIFIGEDFSTDNTAELCQKLKKKFPDKIDLTIHKTNIGSLANAKMIYEKCQNSGAKYIAMCEGDDYWTDPLKLQKQVDFLDSHQEYSMCFHSVRILNETQQKFYEDNITRSVLDTTGLKELAFGNFIHTPSVLFRSIVFPLPHWFKDTPIGDYPLWCLSALKGKIYKMPDKMAVYRVHDQGAMSGFKSANLSDQIVHNEGMIPFYRAIYIQSKELGFKHNEVHLLDVNRSNYVKLGEYSKARMAAFLMLKNELKFLSVKQIVASLLTLLAPSYLKIRYAKK